jgi:hypothetical protein
MKKVLSAVVLSAAVVATAGQAYADSWNNTMATNTDFLTVSMYATDKSREIAMNLGKVGTGVGEINLSAENLFLGNVPWQANLGTTDRNKMNLGIWIDDIATTNSSTPVYSIYWATVNRVVNQLEISAFNSGKYTGFNNGSDPVHTNYYKVKDTDNDGFIADVGGNANSYQVRFNSNGNTPGQYAGINLPFSPLQSELKMKNFDYTDSVNSYVDMFFWNAQFTKFTSTTPASSTLIGDDGNAYVLGANEAYRSIIRVYENGDILLNPTVAPVPVPAAAWLLGSGLLGLVGLRRRK